MKNAQDSVWLKAATCFGSTTGRGLMEYAGCIIKEHGDTGVFIAARISDSSSFDPSTFVVVDSKDNANQILALLPLYWYKSVG